MVIDRSDPNHFEMPESPKVIVLFCLVHYVRFSQKWRAEWPEEKADLQKQEWAAKMQVHHDTLRRLLQLHVTLLSILINNTL